MYRTEDSNPVNQGNSTEEIAMERNVRMQPK